MTSRVSFSFDDRPLVPFAHDYAHGESEPWHEHDCAQLLHILSGVVRRNQTAAASLSRRRAAPAVATAQA
jgi:hypothetical protein